MDVALAEPGRGCKVKQHCPLEVKPKISDHSKYLLPLKYVKRYAG